jgi:hypothetical protein
MATQQIRAIKWLTLLGAAFLSIVVPVLLVSFDVGTDAGNLCTWVTLDVSGS